MCWRENLVFLKFLRSEGGYIWYPRQINKRNYRVEDIKWGLNRASTPRHWAPGKTVATIEYFRAVFFHNQARSGLVWGDLAKSRLFTYSSSTLQTDRQTAISIAERLLYVTLPNVRYCRAMLCKRGLSRHAVSVCLSVCLCVCHVRGLCWNE